MVKLTATQIQAALATAPGWELVEGKLRREYKFPDFVTAMEFVNKVAVIADDSEHHPDIDIRYNRVRLELITHDASALTESDASLAYRLNREIAL